MKKCPYCEAKRTIRKFRTAKRFFAKCEFCKANELKILEQKRNETVYRSEVLERWIGGTGY